MTTYDLERLHDLSRNNEEMVELAGTCSCYYCRSIFPAVAVREFIRELIHPGTAICPLCSVDSVLPFGLSREMLTEMRNHYFYDPARI